MASSSRMAAPMRTSVETTSTRLPRPRSTCLGRPFSPRAEHNTADLSNAIPTAALHPIHVLNDGANNQTNVLGNIFRHGWRGFATGTRTHGLTNTLVANNRFIGLSGAPIAAGGAGLMVQNNYLNLTGDVLSAGTYLTCDSSCTTL